MLEKIRRRGADPVVGVRNFLCVANVDFDSPNYADLWDGDCPRILTPMEIVNLFGDDEKTKTFLGPPSNCQGVWSSAARASQVSASCERSCI
jgi:hypothetical protein